MILKDVNLKFSITKSNDSKAENLGDRYVTNI